VRDLVNDDYDWHFVYSIAADGTYQLITTQEEYGRYQAANGRYRTVGGKTGRVRTGSYRAVGAAAIEVISATGAAIFRPAQPIAPLNQANPIMLGIWRATIVQGGVTWTLTIQNNPDGSYHYEGRGWTGPVASAVAGRRHRKDRPYSPFHGITLRSIS
jgi:hypothetical protein